MKSLTFALPIRNAFAFSVIACLIIGHPALAGPFKFTSVPAPSSIGAPIVFDAGTVSATASPTVDHRFILENAGSLPATLASIAPKGAGTTARLDNNAAPSSITLAPGDLIGVTVSVPVPTRAEAFSGSADVFIAGQKEPAATLRIDGMSSKGFALLTKRLRFGAVKVGATVTRPVYLVVSPYVLASGNVPVVVSTDPEVRMTAPREDVDPASVKGITVPAVFNADARLLVWQATFAPQSVAPEKSRALWLAPADRSIDDNADPHIAIEGIGSADPEISFSPDTLGYGDRVRGSDWSEWVQINASNPTVFSTLRFDSGSLFLQLDLVDPAKHVTMEQAQKLGPNVRYLQVILSAVAPLGKLTTKVTVTTGSGQIVTLPVTANVVETIRPKVKGK